MESRDCNIVGPSALKYRQTKLENENISNEVSIFLPHSENFSNCSCIIIFIRNIGLRLLQI